MAADTAPQDKTPQDRDFKRSAYDFCEKTVARFEANPSRSFSVSRQQTISGDMLRRTYVFTFDVKVTGCELGD
jgi:hypothetical protein